MPVPQEGIEQAGHEASEHCSTEVRLKLACPKCAGVGTLSLQSLRHIIRCKRCDCEFLMARDGELQLQPRPAPARYDCPRCGHAGSLTVRRSVRNAECEKCSCPLVRSSDHRFRGVQEIEPAGRPAGAAKSHPARFVAWSSSLAAFRRRAGRGMMLCAGVLLGGLLITGAVLAARFFLPHEGAHVQRFTRACLSADRSALRQYLPDDPVQKLEFDRWQIRHFASIKDAHRPAGDTIAIQVDLVEESPPFRRYRVTMTSPFIGTRSHQQTWRLLGDQWCFDPAATLTATDARPSLPSPQTR